MFNLHKRKYQKLDWLSFVYNKLKKLLKKDTKHYLETVRRVAIQLVQANKKNQVKNMMALRLLIYLIKVSKNKYFKVNKLGLYFSIHHHVVTVEAFNHNMKNYQTLWVKK